MLKHERDCRSLLFCERKELRRKLPNYIAMNAAKFMLKKPKRTEYGSNGSSGGSPSLGNSREWTHLRSI